MGRGWLPPSSVHKYLVKICGELIKLDVADQVFLTAALPIESHISQLVSGVSLFIYSHDFLPALLFIQPLVPTTWIWFLVFCPSKADHLKGRRHVISYILFAQMAAQKVTWNLVLLVSRETTFLKNSWISNSNRNSKCLKGNCEQEKLKTFFYFLLHSDLYNLSHIFSLSSTVNFHSWSQCSRTGVPNPFLGTGLHSRRRVVDQQASCVFTAIPSHFHYCLSMSDQWQH